MRRHGFTLLETLVALAISVLVLGALYGAVERTATARERTAASAERAATGRTVLLALARELEAALAAPELDPAAPERFVVVAPPDGSPPWSELRFATLAADDVRLLAYRVEAERDERGHLVRRAASRFAPPDAGEPAGVPALPGVRLFRVRCFDGTAWRAQWSAPMLPRAVELTLGIEDDAGGVTELATTATLALGGS